MIAPVPSRFNRNASELVPQRRMGWLWLGVSVIVSCAIVAVVLLA